MPFVSNRDARATLQRLTPYVDQPDVTFSEAFGASLGQVFDEELSISRNLNREGFDERRRRVVDLIADGEINRNEYLDNSGQFDYDRLASEREDLGIKTNATLTDERNRILAQRREYAQDVLSRGSGLAQFLGAATGYALDPITIATLPIATASTAGRSASILGRTMLTARNEAALATAAESVIQPLVYQHKQDIESPWSELDAIQNIGAAAIGAGVLGGTAGGISQWLRNLRERGTPAAQAAEFESPQSNAGDIIDADANLARMEQTLGNAPEFDAKAAEDEFLARLRGELEADSGQRITRKERQELNRELNDLRAQRELELESPQRQADLAEQIQAVETRLFNDEAAEAAQANLAQLDQGVTPDEFIGPLQEAKNRALVEHETAFLQDLARQRRVSGDPSKTVATYKTLSPGDPELPPVPRLTTTTRQRELLDQVGLTKEYDADIEAFNRLQNPRIADDTGENLIDAAPIMKEIDDQLDGLEAVLVCSRE